MVHQSVHWPLLLQILHARKGHDDLLRLFQELYFPVKIQHKLPLEHKMSVAALIINLSNNIMNQSRVECILKSIFLTHLCEAWHST